jgi:histidine triad (HIT) family protein
LYEDDRVFAILNRAPVRPGSAMVLPKVHYDRFVDLTDDLAAHIAIIGNRLARRMLATFNPRPLAVGHVVHGVMPHAHYHVIPQHDWSDITSARYVRLEDKRILFDGADLDRPTDAEQRAMASMLRFK